MTFFYCFSSSSRYTLHTLFTLTITGFLLTSCNGMLNKNASTRSPGGYYKIGEPYQINGTWYYPKEEPHYKEEGVASWYGSDFHNKHTANGDMFDKRALTAAHRTLPLPSMVQVTNLDNGKNLILMVNDRGPFSKNRILDVSERAAEVLGFKSKGTARVRVQNLPNHSQRLLSDLNAAKSQPTVLVEKHYNTDQGIQEEYVLEQTGATVNSSNSDTASESSRPRSFSRRIKDLFTRGKKEDSSPVAAPEATPETSPKTDSIAEPEHISEPTDTKASSAPITTPNTVTSEPSSVSGSSTDTPSSAASIPEKTPTSSASTGNYYIQVGAYSSSTNANRATETLSAIGNVESKEMVMRGKNVTRIRVGPFSSRSDAENLLQRVHDSGYKDALITKQ